MQQQRSVAPRQLAPPKRSVVIISGCANLVFLFASTVVPVSEANLLGYSGYGLFLGSATSLFIATATARVEARGGDIVIQNVFTKVMIPRPKVAGVDSLNGLSIIDAHGKEHGVIAYGESILQIIFSSRMIDEAKARIEDWIADSSSGPESASIATSLRRWWFTGFPIVLIAAQLYELLLYAITPTIRPFVVGG